MRSRLIAARAASAVLLGPLLLTHALAATPSSGEPSTPAEFVKAALRTELDGPTPQRESLLKRALTLDPDYGPAHWHLGQVRWDDRWLTPAEVADRAANDEQLAEYRKRRDQMIDTAAQHRDLARWCKKNQLTDLERIHWAKVLEFDVQDAEALAALGLELYEGRLLTGRQIAQAKERAGEQMRAMKRWQPQALKWRRAIERGGKVRAGALEALGRLSEPKAVFALEVAFAMNEEAEKTDELNLLLIETAGRMAVPEATQVLLRRAGWGRRPRQGSAHRSLQSGGERISQLLRGRGRAAGSRQLAALGIGPARARAESAASGAVTRGEHCGLPGNAS